MDNTPQIELIEELAQSKGLSPDVLAPEWIEKFSERFREIWNTGETDIDIIRKYIYDLPPK